MKLILTIIFFLAFSGTTYFVDRLLTWFLYSSQRKPKSL
jgi:hypothetical protein